MQITKSLSIEEQRATATPGLPQKRQQFYRRFDHRLDGGPKVSTEKFIFPQTFPTKANQQSLTEPLRGRITLAKSTLQISFNLM
jgi:hypothetical protein